MPEVEFKIDTERGTCETEIKGYQGPACEKTAKCLKEMLGNPTTDAKTHEYFVTPHVKRTITRK